MYLRIDDGCNPDNLDTSDIESIGEELGIKINWSRGRCQHGYTRDQSCIECENGYVTDSHTFANVRGPVIVAAVTDDGDSVAYILDNKANQRRIERA